MKKVLPALTALMLTATLAAAPASAQRDRRENTELSLLSVTGTGEARVAPDVATVRLGITRQGPSATTVQGQVNEVAQGILEAVTRLGIDRKFIQTSRLTLQPIYAPQKPDNPEPPRIVAYRASNIVSIRVEDLSKSGPVIDAGLKAGANQLEGIHFGLKNELPAREEALREAVREAQAKANTIAAGLGVRLGKVHEVQEGGVSIVQPYAGGGMLMRAEAAPTPVSPGEITVNATVTVRYRLP
jgi:uncharacterized protein YggE